MRIRSSIENSNMNSFISSPKNDDYFTKNPKIVLGKSLLCASTTSIVINQASLLFDLDSEGNEVVNISKEKDNLLRKSDGIDQLRISRDSHNKGSNASLFKMSIEDNQDNM